MDFRFDVTHQRQELVEDHLTVLLEVLLDYTHLLLGLFLDFSGTAAMRSKCLQTAKGRESSCASCLTRKTLTGFVLPWCMSAISAEGRIVLEEIGAHLDCLLRSHTKLVPAYHDSLHLLSSPPQ